MLESSSPRWGRGGYCGHPPGAQCPVLGGKWKHAEGTSTPPQKPDDPGRLPRTIQNPSNTNTEQMLLAQLKSPTPDRRHTPHSQTQAPGSGLTGPRHRAVRAQAQAGCGPGCRRRLGETTSSSSSHHAMDVGAQRNAGNAHQPLLINNPLSGSSINGGIYSEHLNSSRKDTRTATNINRHPTGQAGWGGPQSKGRRVREGQAWQPHPKAREGSCTQPRKTGGDSSNSRQAALLRTTGETGSCKGARTLPAGHHAARCLKKKLVFPERQACPHPSPLLKSTRHYYVPGTLSTKYLRPLRYALSVPHFTDVEI